MFYFNSGSAEQVKKNKDRAERLGAEISAIKKFTPDEVTKAAVKSKKTFEEVCKNVSNKSLKSWVELVARKLNGRTYYLLCHFGGMFL